MATTRVYTVRPRAFSLSFVLLSLLAFACGAQSINGGSISEMRHHFPSMHLRGGSAPQDEAQADDYMKEQLDYWNSLSKEQQEDLLSKMSPEERANAEGKQSNVNFLSWMDLTGLTNAHAFTDFSTLQQLSCLASP